MPTTVADSITLPCGQVVKNRIWKSALTEGLADEWNRATEGHVNLYRSWANGGTGLLITGNIQVDRRYLERPGNVVIDGPQDEEQIKRLRAYAAAAQENGTTCWVQLGHAGRQCDPLVNQSPVGPSDAKWFMEMPPPGNWVHPRGLTLEEIHNVRDRMVAAALVVKGAGFSGVQLHAAHGYLISSFLNPRANTRTDHYGGSLENRARLLLETVRAVRQAVGDEYPVAVKINSADFQKGGFTEEECERVAGWLDEAKLDVIELSGGNYESPAMMLGPQERAAMNASTIAREAFFMDFARTIRRSVKRAKVMVTGGIRSRAVMDKAIQDGDCEIIGVGRPVCGDPSCTGALLDGKSDALPRWEKTLKLPFWLRPLHMSKWGPKLEFISQQLWYYHQERELGKGKPVNLNKAPMGAVVQVFQEDEAQAGALKGMTTVGQVTNAKPKTVRNLILLAIGLAIVAFLVKRYVIA